MVKKRSLQIIAGIVLCYLLYFIVVLAHGTFTDYQPEPVIGLEADQSSSVTVIEDSVISFTIWNVGYGGLGAESDFFYHSGNMYLAAGQMVRTPKAYVEKNIQASVDFVKNTRSDFFLFQEIDIKSKRNYFINHYEAVGQALPDFSACFATNYKSQRVPIPLLQPWKAYGETLSGLGSYSRFQPSEAIRYQLPGEFSWPVRIFQLDRCLLLQRFPTYKNKELVVLNIHHSAYDSDGALKMQQMSFLKDMVLEEYEKGNYVIVGGDWNLCPPYFAFDSFRPGDTQGFTQINIAPDYLPEDWRWVYDPTRPTNRKTTKPYKKDQSFVTIIDFFLISPNVRVRNVRSIQQDFQFSDHQPVWMEVELL